MKERVIFIMVLALWMLAATVNADNSYTHSTSELTNENELTSQQQVSLFMDDQRIFFNEPLIMDEGNTLVQFRPVFEQLGISIEWDDRTKTVTGTKGKFTISLQIDNPVARVNGVEKLLAVAPRLVNGHTFVPLRFVGESMAYKVDWDGVSNQILITSTLQSHIQDVLFANEASLRAEGFTNLAQQDGDGKLFYKGKLWYEGQFRNNELDGKGKLYDPSGTIALFEGMFRSNTISGQGVLYSATGKKVYEGQWINGYKDGFGVVYTDDGLKLYDGKLKNDLYEGDGMLYNPETGRLIYNGAFVQGKRDGLGKQYDEGSLRYIGEFNADKRNGKGKSYDANGLLRYDGEYKDDIPHGNGTVLFRDGSKYVGGLHEGMFHGYGTYFRRDGIMEMQGEFTDGYFQNVRPVSFTNVVNDVMTTTNYSGGYSYSSERRSPSILTIGITKNRIVFFYTPTGSGPERNDYQNVSNILIISKQDYNLNPGHYLKVTEKDDMVYVYVSVENPYANEGETAKHYDKFIEASNEAMKVIGSFKLIGMFDI